MQCCPSHTIAKPLVAGSARRVTARVVAAVKHCKANVTLTKLNLGRKMVANAVPAALADAVRATVLTCGSELHVPGFKTCLVVKSDGLAILTSSSLEINAQPSASHGYPARVVACGIWRDSEIKVDARGAELRNLPYPWQCAWLLCAVVARHEDRGAMCTLFQLRALRNVSIPAVVKFTPRVCLFAIVLPGNNTQHYVVVVCFFFSEV